MRRILVVSFLILGWLCAGTAMAMLSLELTHGMVGAAPIIVLPFTGQTEDPDQDIAAIINNDLRNSGRFKPITTGSFLSNNVTASQLDYFRKLGADHVVCGQIQPLSGQRYRISFQLLDVFTEMHPEDAATDPRRHAVIKLELIINNKQWRAAAHHISNVIYQRITGMRGVFATRLAYVVVQHETNPRHYILEVADQDGYNPKPLLISPDPIMSPAWSPDGKKIAYVSFEKHHAAIYIEELASGARRLISEFPGINGAPAWSPDGKKLAIVLSRNGSPNVYLLELATGKLSQLTHDTYINTEPAWSPDGKSLVFTSNRGSKPQIYQKNLQTGTVSRLTYEGDYNARASFTRDGSNLVMISRSNGLFNIGVLNLENGRFNVLTSSQGDSSSPSAAPNGSIILYDTVYAGHSILAMVTIDGKIQLRLPARNGEAQDPAWSPFLS